MVACRRGAMLWSLVLAASAVCAAALPAHVDDAVRPDGWTLSARIRAARASHGATRAAPDRRVVLPPAPDVTGAASSLHSEGELTGRYQVSERVESAPDKTLGARQTHPDAQDGLRQTWDDDFRTSDDEDESSGSEIEEKPNDTPVPIVPAEEPAPVKDISVANPPAQEQKLPMKDAPEEEAPLKDPSANKTPVKEVEKEATDNAASDKESQNGTPNNERSEEGEAAEDASVFGAPAEIPPTKDTAAENPAGTNAPMKNTATGSSPIKDTPEENAAMKDSAAENVPQKVTPEDTQTQSIPTKGGQPMEEAMNLSGTNTLHNLPNTQLVLPVADDALFVREEDSDLHGHEIRDSSKEIPKDPFEPETEEINKKSESSLSPLASELQEEESVQESAPDQKKKEDTAASTSRPLKIPEEWSAVSEQNQKENNAKTNSRIPVPSKEESAEGDRKSEAAAASHVGAPAETPRRNAPGGIHKNLAARPQVQPSPPRDFIAENPLYEWTFPCSDKEKSCLQEDRVLYEGDRQCYQLWRTGPCERGQWLVIDKSEAVNGSGRFRAVCSNVSRCAEREVLMASDGRCHALSQIIREVCPKHDGLQLSYNVFGEGECKCDNCPAPQLPSNTFNEGRCAFPPSFYRAGPAAEGEGGRRAPSRLLFPVFSLLSL